MDDLRRRLEAFLGPNKGPKAKSKVSEYSANR